jgi:hypothetical protein
MFFNDSRPDRQKRARREGLASPIILQNASIPPARPYQFLTKEEILSGGNRTLFFDVESYPNYFEVGFKCAETKKFFYFEDNPSSQIDIQFLAYILYRFKLIGFNSKSYDLPILAYALDGVRSEQLKILSNKIILDEERPRYDMRLANVNHIDLINVAPLTASLKMYGARLHCERLQDLPYPHDKILTYEEACNVRDYNLNDLDITELLYDELKSGIQLRENMGAQYQLDLRSKSDSQVAESIILSELKKLGVKVGKSPWTYGDTFRFEAPAWLQFRTPLLQRVFDTVKDSTFKIEANGYADTPKAITDLQIKIGNCTYRMGNGGLHSSEKNLSIYATDKRLLIDRDVASYYPKIVLNGKIYPKHIGPVFLEVYGPRIVERRLSAKALLKTTTAIELIQQLSTETDGLKIAANGTFGKTGNQYSDLYAPDMTINITIGGQLYLLMLIEAIELIGINIVSANTDGIVIDCPIERYLELEQVVTEWEKTTGFVTEETRYKSLHARDVNNYIAVKQDNKCKTKGIYCERGSALNSVLSKNPETLIVADAIQSYISNGSDIRNFIKNCKDIRRFVSVRSVKGGGEKAGTYLGKTVRWYYANGTEGTINYVLSGNAVPKTEGAKPCMLLPTSIPDDLDYEWYIQKANEMLYDLGIKQRASVGKLI